MRILDNTTNEEIMNVSVFLTVDEVSELFDTVGELVNNISKNEYHLHINDKCFSREITLAVYTKENTKYFDPRVQKLLDEK